MQFRKRYKKKESKKDPSKLSKHDKLVHLGAAWIWTRGAQIVLTEFTIRESGEIPDIFAINQAGNSFLIECKASKSDLKSDKNKSFRTNPERGMGRYRYYLFTRKLWEKLDEVERARFIPKNWGILVTNKPNLVNDNLIRIEIKRNPIPYENYNIRYEQRILISCIRRIGCGATWLTGMSVKFYVYHNKAKRATFGVMPFSKKLKQDPDAKNLFQQMAEIWPDTLCMIK